MSFQFQYGSIKRSYSTPANITPRAFQFQYGSIKRRKRINNDFDALGFNSNMVRLKAVTNELTSKAVQFQFQYGSIKSLALRMFTNLPKSFNSNMVRLKEQQGKYMNNPILRFNSNMVRLKAPNTRRY